MRIEPKEPGSNLPTSQKSLGELFGDLSTQISALVRQEVQLAKTEITRQNRRFSHRSGFSGRGRRDGLGRLFGDFGGSRRGAFADFTGVGRSPHRGRCAADCGGRGCINGHRQH